MVFQEQGMLGSLGDQGVAPGSVKAPRPEDTRCKRCPTSHAMTATEAINNVEAIYGDFRLNLSAIMPPQEGPGHNPATHHSFMDAGLAPGLPAAVE